MPENTSFHATLNHQHHNQQSIPQSPQQQQQQQQQQPPNNPYQGMQVWYPNIYMFPLCLTPEKYWIENCYFPLEYAGDKSG